MANRAIKAEVQANQRVDCQKEIIKLIKEAAYSRDIYKVFNDFLEMSAIAVSNVADVVHRAEREKRYLELINSYGKNEQQLFPQMLAHLVEGLDEKVQTVGTEDILGLIFHELELHNKYKGQFFTPQHISDMMSEMVCGDDRQAIIKEKGYITMCETTCGSGVMVTSFAKAMKKVGLNYCTQLVVTAIDCDLKCVHMTYLQLSLYGIPAVVIHGDSLTVEEWSRWYTPVYILNGWVWRQQCGITIGQSIEDEMLKCALEPTYVALRAVEALIPDNIDKTAGMSNTGDNAIITENEVATASEKEPETSVLTAETAVLQPELEVEQLSLF